MGRTLSGAVLLLVAVVIGLAFFSGHLGAFIDQLNARVTTKAGVTPVPFPGRRAGIG